MHKHIRQDFGGSAPTALGLALAMAFAGAARADENDAVARLTQPESSVTLGLGHVSGDSRHFGIYGGQGGEGTLGFGAFSIVNRDDASGTWFRAQGRSMGRDNAELRLEHERQGHWQYFLELDQMTRTSPYEVYSRLQGFGGNDLAYPATAGAQSRATTRLPDVKAERLGARLGLTHLFSPELEIRVLFQNVDKKGERLFGRGTPSVEEFLAEPINSVTRQLDVALNYTGERFQLSGAYYGSWYQNADSQLNVAGGNSSLRLAAGPNLPFSAIALPPDNFAHQIDVTGGYQFTHTTRGNFTVAYTQARQFDSFISVPAPTSGGLPAGGLNLSGRSNLGGKLDTTLVNLGLTSRPLKDLFLLGSYRYEDRHDQTAVARYINVTFPPNASTDGFNEPRSLTVRTGKLEASYQLPQGYRLTAGLENEEKERSVAGVRVVGYRDRTTEASYRLELKRAISESVNGAIAYIHSDRTGSAYRPLQRINASGPVANSYSNRLQPLYIADRDRDRVRLFADWTPADPLTLQFTLEDSRDSYGRGRDASNLGARSGGARLYSVDASWTVSERWRANAWVSRSETWMNQADCVAPASATAVCSTASYWTAALTNHVDAIGVGVRGRVTGTIDIGADAMVSRDKSVHRLAGAAASLPDIRYDQATLRFFGRYAMEKDTSLRIDYVFDHRRNDDWTWNGTPASGPFVYTDGTYLYQRPEDKVHFIGLSVSHAFR